MGGGVDLYEFVKTENSRRRIKNYGLKRLAFHNWRVASWKALGSTMELTICVHAVPGAVEPNPNVTHQVLSILHIGFTRPDRHL